MKTSERGRKLVWERYCRLDWLARRKEGEREKIQLGEDEGKMFVEQSIRRSEAESAGWITQRPEITKRLVGTLLPSSRRNLGKCRNSSEQRKNRGSWKTSPINFDFGRHNSLLVHWIRLFSVLRRQIIFTPFETIVPKWNVSWLFYRWPVYKRSVRSSTLPLQVFKLAAGWTVYIHHSHYIYIYHSSPSIDFTIFSICTAGISSILGSLV